MTAFAAALAAGPLVLDGGLGTLLEARGNDLSSALWSARLLLEEPEEIQAAHADFFAAGARVAISASYQVGYDALAARGRSAPEVDALLARSVALARAARDDAGLAPGEGWVAASVGPYGATRADGSEYTGAYGLTVAELRDWHRRRLGALAAAGPDVLAVETIPSLAEIEAVSAELAGTGLPAWISMTVADGRLRSGESIDEAVRIAASVPEVVAIGVNCASAKDADVAADRIRAATDLPIVVYPNSGERWNAITRTWSGDGAGIHDHVGEWVAAGARLIGGCCRVGPAQIAEIARAVADG